MVRRISRTVSRTRTIGDEHVQADRGACTRWPALESAVGRQRRPLLPLFLYAKVEYNMPGTKISARAPAQADPGSEENMTFCEAGLTSPHVAALEPIENYLKAHITGKAEYMRMAFHPDARIVSFRDGVLHSLSVDEFSVRFQGQPAADEAQRKRYITHFDVTGNAGSAKVVLQYPDVTFTDYMTLLEIDGVWKISNKTFSAAPPVVSK
jgi:hypothetical protein